MYKKDDIKNVLIKIVIRPIKFTCCTCTCRRQQELCAVCGLESDSSSQGWASPHHPTIHVNCLAQTKLIDQDGIKFAIEYIENTKNWNLALLLKSLCKLENLKITNKIKSTMQILPNIWYIAVLSSGSRSSTSGLAIFFFSLWTCHHTFTVSSCVPCFIRLMRNRFSSILY